MNLKNCFFLIIFLITITLNSCFEISQKVTFNSDYSGNINLKLNLSQSKGDIGLILQTGKLFEQKVPTLDEIKSNILRLENTLKRQKGISNVVAKKDFENFIFEVNFDFENTKYLDTAINNIGKSIGAPSSDFVSFYNYENNSIKVSNPISWIQLDPKLVKQYEEQLTKARLYHIIKTPAEVKDFTNKKYFISKNSKALMFTANLNYLATGSYKLSNTINL